MRYCPTVIQKTPEEIKDIIAKINVCNFCLTPGHISNRCPLKKFGCATCSRHGEDLTIVKTHLSWNCNRHPGLIELHATTLELSKKTTTAKVLRTTTNQYPDNKEQDCLGGNQSQDDKDEEQNSIHHLEGTHLLIQDSEETEIEPLIFGQPIEEQMDSRSTIIKEREISSENKGNKLSSAKIGSNKLSFD